VTDVRHGEAVALIEGDGLSVGRRVPLLRDVALRIAAGEAWFVLGPNGAGKSTLVQTLLGLLAPLAGTIRRAPAVASRRAVGYVPQELRFRQSLPVTVAEFVQLALDRDDGGMDRRRQRVGQALAAMHVADLARRDVGALSLGQRRRVLVARALARRPQLLVLDEPTANLDAAGARRLLEDLERLRRDESLAMLHVSHDLALVERYATHVAFVYDGHVRSGERRVLAADPAFAAWLQGGV